MRLGTKETLAFVLRWLPRQATVLEVGCGDGELAAELTKRGFDVTAIDSDAQAVEEARSRDVNAQVATWPFRSAAARLRYAAILFTRSLHHISPLDEAVEAAKEVSNLILIEDFAVNEVSEAFAAWLKGMKPDWEPHDVHPFAAIRTEVARHFTIRHEERAPYCYRYFDPPRDREIYGEEIARGELLGRRIAGVA